MWEATCIRAGRKPSGGGPWGTQKEGVGVESGNDDEAEMSSEDPWSNRPAVGPPTSQRRPGRCYKEAVGCRVCSYCYPPMKVGLVVVAPSGRSGQLQC